MALDLDGSTDHATAPTACMNRDEGAFSVWAAPDFAPTATTEYWMFDCDGTHHSFYKRAVSNLMGVYIDGRARDFDVTSAWTSGAWAHFLWLWKKSTDLQSLYINGTLRTESNLSGVWGATALGINTYFGCDLALGRKFDGDYAEPALWSVSNLDAGERNALALGYSPNCIRPASRLSYWTLVRDIGTPNHGSQALTITGSPPVTAHPRIFYPRK